jgi:predicted phosphohydrolase
MLGGLLVGGIMRKLLGPLIALVVIGGLIYAGKAYIENKDKEMLSMMATISSKNLEINQLNNNIGKLNSAVQGYKNRIIDIEYEKTLAIEETKNIAAKNKTIKKSLRQKDKKLVGRDMSRLRNSRHRELVLKIINKSVKKQFKVFEDNETNNK